MSLKQEIKLLASDYELGDSSHLLECPSCKGGITKEYSFSITIVPEGILYNCFRASCSIHGFIPNYKISTQPIKKDRPPNPFRYSEVPLENQHISFLIRKFPSLTEEQIHKEGIAFCPESGRILYPVYDVRGYRFAVNARAYQEFCPNFKTKSVLYFDSMNVPRLHFPLGMRFKNELVLVEDQVSALCASVYTPTAALLGTSLTPSTCNHLHNCGVTSLVIALDNDATAKAISLYKKIKLEFNVSILPLDKDIKNKTADEIRRLFRKDH